MYRRLLLTVLVVATMGFAVFAAYQHHHAQQRDTAVHQSLAAATAAAQAIFSYDYRSFDTSVANGQSFVTGDFATQYGETTTALKANALKEQAVVRATVSASGVVSASTDRVELLLYLNQYRHNANVTGEKVDQNRVVLTMIRIHNDWKVSAATAL
jgi:Mce-associated membrane protein